MGWWESISTYPWPVLVASRLSWKKRQQITIAQEENAELERENNLRRERIQKLKDSREEQELEIRKRLKLEKPGTRDFYIPEAADSKPSR